MSDNNDKVIEQLVRKDEWNAAIEAAADKIEALGSFAIAHEIRKLKK